MKAIEPYVSLFGTIESVMYLLTAREIKKKLIRIAPTGKYGGYGRGYGYGGYGGYGYGGYGKGYGYGHGYGYGGYKKYCEYSAHRISFRRL